MVTSATLMRLTWQNLQLSTAQKMECMVMPEKSALNDGKHVQNKKYKEHDEHISKIYGFKRGVDPFSLKYQ